MLSRHVALMHTNRIRPACNICNKTLSNQKNLRNHIDFVHNKKEQPRFPCGFPGCEITYLYKSDVLKHVRAEHAENPVRYPCTLCGKDFKTRTDLGQHIYTHTTEKPFKCATCGKSFAFRKVLRNHKRTHIQKSSRETLKCQLCLQTFLTRNGLQGHDLVIHQNRRNYRCTFCDKSFGGATDLKRHVEVKHNTDKDVKIYACDKCEYKSHLKRYLAKHMGRHNIENRIDCYFCAKQFVRFQELVQHSRVHTLEK
ncbi:zinc finger protein 431 [Folsomia candida]|nr:zinc finger protein 431 [Folsomia candida]